MTFSRWTCTAAIILILVTTLALAGSSSQRVIKTRGELTEAQIERLHADGVTVLDSLGRNTYIVRGALSAMQFDFVSSVVDRSLDAKMSPALRSALVAPASSGSTISLMVSLYDSASAGQLVDRVRATGGKALSNVLYGERMLVEVPLHALAWLAESDTVRAVEHAPHDKVIFNTKAARVSRITDIRKNWNLTGTSIRGGIWDGGAVFAHDDFSERLTVVELSEELSISDHATHVAGTIIGAGIGKRKATGMAPAAELFSYDFEGDVPKEMLKAAKRQKIQFANNSWGFANGWSYHSQLKLWIWWGKDNFGRYSSESAAYDRMIEKTDLIVLFAAGNDRGEVGTTDEKYLDMTIGRGNDEYHAPDGPYMTVDVTGSAKNVITVGAVDKRKKMTGFSSWGPTRDGRIKPEIVAVGQDVLSTLPDGMYGKYSGTSMATPAASGGVALLLEHYESLTGDEASAALIRSLLAASAADLGETGPDYQHGFGLFDAEVAAELMEKSLEDGLLIEDAVSKSGADRTRTYTFKIDGNTRNLRLALAWIDPAGHPDAEIALVNDLDMRLTAPDGSTTHLPWILDPAHPEAAAVHGDNQVDNIETIDVAMPMAGTWTVTVSADYLGKGNSQRFALVVNSSTPLAGPVVASR